MMDKMMRQYEKLDIEAVRKNHFVSVGRVSQRVIDFIRTKSPLLADRISTDAEIIFWEDRIPHIEAHRYDFSSDIFFEDCIAAIPSIISSPDYIAIKPENSSISFIRAVSQNVSVVVRISASGRLSFRTMYTLMEAQLSDYIRKDRAWKYSDI